MQIEDKDIKRKINLIQNNDGRIKNMKFATLLSLLNQEQLDDEILYEFLTNTKDTVFSYFDEDEMKELYNNSISKNSNLLRKIGNIVITFRDFFDKFKQKNNISETGHSDEYQRLYEICDLAFYANKVTKTICLPCLSYLNSKSNIEELDKLYQMEFSGNIYFEDDFKKRSLEFQYYYEMYRLVKRAENICYSIKDASIRKMLDILYKDNYNKIKTWGFFNDNKGNMVFAIDFPFELGGTFQFHIPNDESILPKYFSDNSDIYSFPFRDIVKKHPKHISIRNINVQEQSDNMQTLETFKKEEERQKYYFSISNGMNVFSIFSEVEPNPILPHDSITTFSSEELRMREAIIEQLRRNPKIAIQDGNNLDINASIYAVQRFCIENGIIQNEDELEVKRIGAGNFEPDTLNIDTGSLNGIKLNGLKINADENLGEKSACAVLARLGFYVPREIIKNADIIYGNEILNSRCGLILARQLKGKKLFDFAESIRKETGEPLITANLTDEEIERFDLTDFYKKREKDIEDAKAVINSNVYDLSNGKKIAIIPQFVNYGSFIAYSQGVDYYCSIAGGKDKQGITFAITANPKTEDGKLPKELIEFGYTLRRQYNIGKFDSGVFVSQDYDKIIAGGPKNKDFSIYPHMDSSEAINQFITDLKILLGIEVEQELPNILSNANSFGNKSRVDALTRMNEDVERKCIGAKEGDILI